jgi:hypothetical protein
MPDRASDGIRIAICQPGKQRLAWPRLIMLVRIHPLDHGQQLFGRCQISVRENLIQKSVPRRGIGLIAEFFGDIILQPLLRALTFVNDFHMYEALTCSCADQDDGGLLDHPSSARVNDNSEIQRRSGHPGGAFLLRDHHATAAFR